MGDDELVVELALLFIDSTASLIATIHDAMARADAQAVSRGAHSVKGAAANLYAERLRAAAGRLEDAGKRNDLSEMLVLVEKVAVEFNEASKYLRSELKLPTPT
jgi:polar amino acid transport system substrate-binding protein